jgi:hypothetical protein
MDIPDIATGTSLLYSQGLIRTVLLLSMVHEEEPVDIVDMPVFAASYKAHWDNFLPLAIIVFKPAFLESAIRYQAPPAESDVTWFRPLNNKPSGKSVALNVWTKGAEALVA